MAEKGARVALFDLNADAGEALAREIGGIFCKVDVTEEASVDAAFANARRANGQESVLVCCAGISNAFKTASRSKTDGSISHFPVAEFDRVVQVTCWDRSAA